MIFAAIYLSAFLVGMGSLMRARTPDSLAILWTCALCVLLAALAIVWVG